MKKEYGGEENKGLETQKNFKVNKNKFGFSQPKSFKYGFEQFNRTNYATQSCMKEFYKKYSQFNTLTRKHPLETFTKTPFGNFYSFMGFY